MVASGPVIDNEYNVALCEDQIIPGKAIKQSVTVRSFLLSQRAVESFWPVPRTASPSYNRHLYLQARQPDPGAHLCSE